MASCASFRDAFFFFSGLLEPKLCGDSSQIVAFYTEIVRFFPPMFLPHKTAYPGAHKKTKTGVRHLQGKDRHDR